MIIIEELEKNGINLTEAQSEKMTAFCRILLEYNQKMNLTSITDEREIAVKHLLDSIKGLKYLPEKGKIVDVGSGAGFPSIPLIIAGEKDGRDFVLLDSLRKRVDFLNHIIKELDLKNAVAVHARAEEEGRKNREFYDCAIARAVAPLNVLLEYSMPLLKEHGVLVAYKGKPDEEIAEAERAMKTLRCEIKAVDRYRLSGEYDRSFVIVEKIGKTPDKYPRGQNKPRILPL